MHVNTVTYWKLKSKLDPNFPKNPRKLEKIWIKENQAQWKIKESSQNLFLEKGTFGQSLDPN